MLRITISVDDSTPTIRLDGKLLAPWIEEVRSTVTSACDQGRARVHLDGLTFADQAGIELLHELTATGVVVEGASPFIHELLANFARPLR